MILIITPLLALFLMLPVARLLARSLARTPPADGTAGPWCLRCSYALAGLNAGVLCPECGGSRRFEAPSGSPYARYWTLGGLVASILSHAPLLWPWLSGMGRAPRLLAPIAFQSFIVAAVMLVLSCRTQGRSLWIALALLVVPQIAADGGVYALLHSPTQSGGWMFMMFIYPALQYLIAPLAFIIVGLIWAFRSRQGWRTTKE